MRRRFSSRRLTGTHPQTCNTLHPLHLAWIGPGHVSVGADWQAEGVGRQIHGEGERQAERNGEIETQRESNEKADEVSACLRSG